MAVFIVEQILSNAVKYTQQGSVTIRVEGDRQLVIEDTGIGIAAEDIPRIFEKVIPEKMAGLEKIYRDRSVFESDGCEKVRAYDLGRIHSGRGKFLQNRPEFL